MAGGPLAGVRVLDLSRLLPGPFCSWYLASLGAEVIRVEPPGGGDYTRDLPPLVQGRGVFFASINRGKRSICLDLRKMEGARVFREGLIPTADVVLESFKPGTLARAGLAPEALLATKPSLVVCSISGYGQDGPLVHEPGHDVNYCGYAGFVAAQPGAAPLPAPVQLADLCGGALTAALGIAASLVGAQRTGAGRWLDISMTEGTLALLAPALASLAAEERDFRPGAELLTGGYAGYRTYACADGGLLTFGPLEPKFWANFTARVEGAPDTPDVALLAELFATRPRDAWVELLRGCCVGPALRATELASHPLFVARDSFEQVLGVPMPKAPFRWAPAPVVAELGADTEQVLSDALLAPLGTTLQALVEAGVAARGTMRS